MRDGFRAMPGQNWIAAHDQGLPGQAVRFFFGEWIGGTLAALLGGSAGARTDATVSKLTEELLRQLVTGC